MLQHHVAAVVVLGGVTQQMAADLAKAQAVVEELAGRVKQLSSEVLQVRLIELAKLCRHMAG